VKNVKLHLHISEELGAALLEEELNGVPSGYAERVRANPLRASELIKLAIERRLASAEGQLLDPAQPEFDEVEQAVNEEVPNIQTVQVDEEKDQANAE